jgi:hypothetical protein
MEERSHPWARASVPWAVPQETDTPAGMPLPGRIAQQSIVKPSHKSPNDPHSSRPTREGRNALDAGIAWLVCCAW